jgi:hypothetical protein
MSTGPNAPQFAPDGWAVPQQFQQSPGVPLPELIRRIPDDQPLVLRHRARRFVAVFGSLYVGVPLVLILAAVVFLLTAGGVEFGHIGLIGLIPFAIMLVGGLAQLGIVLGFSLPGGPALAANDEGVWVRARKWPARSVFLPWPAVARVYTRRWFWDRAICVLPHDGRAGSNAGAWARVDMAVQKALFGSRLTASTFYCGRRADDVLAELHRLSGGRVYIG